MTGAVRQFDRRSAAEAEFRQKLPNFVDPLPVATNVVA
jgi:hypothetical protein